MAAADRIVVLENGRVAAAEEARMWASQSLMTA